MKKVFVVYDGTKWEIGPPEKVFELEEEAIMWIEDNPGQNWEIKELELL